MGIDGITNQVIIIWEDRKDILNMKNFMKKLKGKENRDQLIEKYKLDTWVFLIFMIGLGLVALW